MKKETIGNIKSAETSRKSLAYTKEFKSILILNKDRIKDFLQLAGKIKNVEQGQIFGDSRFNVVLVRVASGNRFFKVNADGKIYFVKETLKENLIPGGGTKELLSSGEVSRILQANGINWARVTFYKLGFENKNKAYFVSSWDDSLSKNFDYWISPSEVSGISAEEKEEIKSKAERLIKLLGSLGFFDVGYNNMSYDPVTKKIILFDLYKEINNEI